MTRKRNVYICPRHSPLLTPWGRLSLGQRVHEIVRFAGERNGQAVSLNMSEPFEAAMLRSADPMCAIRKRMSRELSELDLRKLPILLILEADKNTGRIHLHGVFIADGSSKKSIKKAMRTAAGYVSGKAGSRQIDARSIWQAVGWSKYIVKGIEHTRTTLGLSSEDNLVWKSHSITRGARADYEAIRLAKVKPANKNLRPNSTAI